MRKSCESLENNRPNGSILRGVFVVVGGGRIPCAYYINLELQNAYSEGYTGSVEVTNLFVCNFFGELIHAAINFPGSWHDSKLAHASYLIHLNLSDEQATPGFAILGDSAFVENSCMVNGKIFRGQKSTESRGISECEELAAINLVLQRITPSKRQSAGWGVRSVKAPFVLLSPTISR